MRMRHVRGFRDIKTHGTLDGEGRLVSVARHWHRIGEGERESSENRSWDGEIKPIRLKRGMGTRKPPRNFFQDLALERNILVTQIAIAQELIAEMEGFVEEGLPGALVELSRLKTKLSRLELGGYEG